MPETLNGKLIADLSEATSVSETDVMVIQTSNETKKIKWATILEKIRNDIKEKISEWAFSTLNTTAKTIPDAINEINGKRLLIKSLTLTGDAAANTNLNMTVNWGGISPKAYFIKKVAGSYNTSKITFYAFTTDTNVRVISSVDQSVTVWVAALY